MKPRAGKTPRMCPNSANPSEYCETLHRHEQKDFRQLKSSISSILDSYRVCIMTVGSSPIVASFKVIGPRLFTRCTVNRKTNGHRSAYTHTLSKAHFQLLRKRNQQAFDSPPAAQASCPLCLRVRAGTWQDNAGQMPAACMMAET